MVPNSRVSIVERSAKAVREVESVFAYITRRTGTFRSPVTAAWAAGPAERAA